jgi:4-nitrophenyl phosphatase
VNVPSGFIITIVHKIFYISGYLDMDNTNPTKKKSNPIKAMIIDMDGVLWRGPEPIGDLSTVFKRIEQLGINAILATNNPTLTIEQYLEKLDKFGVTLNPNQVITSAIATAQYIHDRYPQGGPVYVIGEDGVRQAITDLGFYHSQDGAQAVIVSLDRNLTYQNLLHATLLIRSGVPFIVTNPDSTLPIPDGFAPGAGSISAAIQAATDTEPLVIGKPQPEMYRIALDRMRVNPDETIVVGDRLETDIAGGQALGCITGVVLSGVSTREDAISWKPTPDFVEPDLAALVENL